MNTLKHMEAIFLVTLAVAGPASVVIDALPDAHARTPTTAVAAARSQSQPMPVVVISAKRMSTEEKQQSLEEEARRGDLRLAARSST